MQVDRFCANVANAKKYYFMFIYIHTTWSEYTFSCFWTHTKSKSNTKVIARYFCWWMQMKISWSNNIWFWSIERMMISHKPFLFIIWFLDARNIILGISFPLFISRKMIQNFLCLCHFHKYQIPFKWRVTYLIHFTREWVRILLNDIPRLYILLNQHGLWSN